MDPIKVKKIMKDILVMGLSWKLKFQFRTHKYLLFDNKPTNYNVTFKVSVDKRLAEDQQITFAWTNLTVTVPEKGRRCVKLKQNKITGLVSDFVDFLDLKKGKVLPRQS